MQFFFMSAGSAPESGTRIRSQLVHVSTHKKLSEASTSVIILSTTLCTFRMMHTAIELVQHSTYIHACTAVKA